MQNTFYVNIKKHWPGDSVEMVEPSAIGSSTGAQSHLPQNSASEMVLDLAGMSEKVVELYGKSIERLADR